MSEPCTDSVRLACLEWRPQIGFSLQKALMLSILPQRQQMQGPSLKTGATATLSIKIAKLGIAGHTMIEKCSIGQLQGKVTKTWNKYKEIKTG